MHSWSLGSSENERITVKVLSKPAKDRIFSYDSVDAEIDIRVGGFTGHFPVALPFLDLVDFRDQLVRIHESLDGVAELSQIMERQIELKVTMNRRGHYSVEGQAIDRTDGGNVLRFRLTGDQTHLGETIHELNRTVDDCQDDAG